MMVTSIFAAYLLLFVSHDDPPFRRSLALVLAMMNVCLFIRALLP